MTLLKNRLKMQIQPNLNSRISSTVDNILVNSFSWSRYRWWNYSRQDSSSSVGWSSRSILTKECSSNLSDTNVDNNDVIGNHGTVSIFHQAQSTLGWIGSVLHVEHNSLWETLALFIKTNREENTRHFVEYYYFIMLGISWDEKLGRVEGYLYYTLGNLDLTNVNLFPKISRSLS